MLEEDLLEEFHHTERLYFDKKIRELKLKDKIMKIREKAKHK